MNMKQNKYAVCILSGAERIVILAVGNVLEEDNSLAIVKVLDKKLILNHYSIIDIASGLGIIHNKRKNKLLENWQNTKHMLYPRINLARLEPYYKKACEFLKRNNNDTHNK